MEDPAAVAEREQTKKGMDETLKWAYAAGGFGMLGYALWQFGSESAKAARAARRERQPWEVE